MALLETVGLLVAVVFLIYYLATRKNDYWAKRNIPYEKPTPIFGCMLDNILGKKAPGEIITDIYRKNKGEKVAGVFLFTEPALMVRDPDLVTQILTTDYHNFAKNNFPLDESQDPVFAKNMFFQAGEKWKQTRQALSPAFTNSKIKVNYDGILKTADKLIQHLKVNSEVEVKSTLSLYTSEIVATIGLGIDGHSFTDKEAMLPKLGHLMFDPDWKQALKFSTMAFLPSVAKLLKLSFAPKLVHEFFDGILRDLIQDREKHPSKRIDLLQYYIDLRKKRLISRNDDQREIHEDDIIAGIVSFFVEGYETSALMSSFLLLHMVNDLTLQGKLRAEVDELYERTKGQFSMEDVIDLPLLHRFWLETHRFYPVETLNKVCTKACDLDIGDGRKLHVEEGTPIVIPMGGIQQDPLYWENGDQFDPDNFLPEKQTARRKGVYFPFGDGPRICIGMRMAHASIKTAMVKILRNFDIVRTSKTAAKFEQDPGHFLMAQKGGVHVKFVKRSNI